jgi:hypothetical protein
MATLQEVQELLVPRGFSPFRPSEELMDELKELAEGERRGIYVHVLHGGSHFYVGLSVDVRVRYQQHLETYGEIEHSSFLLVPEPDDLAPVEMEYITLLREKGATLLNVLIPFEVKPSLESEEERDDRRQNEKEEIFGDYLNGGWDTDLRGYQTFGPTAYRPEELPKFAKRYASLLAHPGYKEDLVDFVSYFIRTVIPSADVTQSKFWSLNCMTETSRDGSEDALFRVSVQRPEILSILWNKPGDGIAPYCFTFTMAYGPFDRLDFKALFKITGGDGYESPFKTARFPHLHIEVDTLDKAWQILAVPGFRRALRQCAWLLMQQGKMQSRLGQAHCLPLCSDVFSRQPKLPEKYAALCPLTTEDVLSKVGADSAWLSNENYCELLNTLFAKAVAGDEIAASELLRHSQRHIHRDPFWMEEAISELVEDAVELQPLHPKTWEVMKLLTQCDFPIVSARAALATCRLRPAENDDLLAVKDFCGSFKGSDASKKKVDGTDLDIVYAELAYRYEGATLAGILHTGDQLVVPFVVEAWKKLDKNAQKMFFAVKPELASLAYVSFALDRLFESADDAELQEVIICNLVDLPGEVDEKMLGNLNFNFGSKPGAETYSSANDGSTYFADFAKSNEEAIMSIGEYIQNPEGTRRILDAWAEWGEDTE